MKTVTTLVLYLVASTLSHQAIAQDLLVERRVNLRRDPSTDQPPIRLLEPGARLELLEPSPQLGFYRVRTEDDEEGFVWMRNVTREDVTSALEAKSTLDASSPLSFDIRLERARTRSSGPCAASLDRCPEAGCSAAGSSHGIANQFKKTIPDTSSDPTHLTFDDVFQLQDHVDNVLEFEQGADLTRTRRMKLRNIDLASVTVGEGSYVQIIGFIAPDRELRPAGPESVNCRLTGASNNDVHIPIVKESDHGEFDSVVVEPIPQARQSTWTLTNFRRLQRNGTLLLVRGQLFYDNIHKVNDDPDHVLSGEPKRFSVWEVHPVTEFLVCKVPDNECDANRPEDWGPIEN